MTRQYEDYLVDIADSIAKIRKFVSGMTFEEFEVDEKTVFAVIRAFEILGEAARNIPEDVQQKYPQVEWEKISRMRNKLIHEYFGTDSSIIWETILKDIPILESQIQQIIQKSKK